MDLAEGIERAFAHRQIPLAVIEDAIVLLQKTALNEQASA
jgi:hypothetical protein